MKQNVSIDLRETFLCGSRYKIVGLALAPFSEIVENHCCGSKKNVNYHSTLLPSQNDQAGSVVV